MDFVGNLRAFALLAAFWAAGAAQAQIETVSVQTEGRGPSRGAAVEAALLDAVKQVNGVSFDLDQVRRSAMSRLAARSSDGSVSELVLQEEVSKEIKQKLSGAVSSYSVDQADEMGPGDWIANVTAQIARYNAPGASGNRRRIAMALFDVPKSSFPCGGAQLSSATVRADLRDKLNAFFTQSRRFDVLSRQDAEALSSEKSTISTDSPVEELCKIGRQMGLDYIIVGKIRNFLVSEPRTIRLQLTGRTKTALDRALMEVEFRIVVVATSQIKWADSVAIDLAQADIAALGFDPTTIYRALLDSVARAVSEQSLANIYPIRAAALLPTGEVVLNQGGALVAPGTLYDAFLLGDEIRNASTGESLGRAETFLTTLAVTRSDAKLAYAAPVEGAAGVTAEQVAAGIVVRGHRPRMDLSETTDSPVSATPVKNSAVEISNGGGVKLPFD